MIKHLSIIPFSASAEMTSASYHIPARSDIPDKYKWQLSSIYSSDKLWQQDYDKLPTLLSKIKAFEGKLGDTPETLLACLKQRDEIGIISGKLYAYAKMHRDENTTDNNYQALTSKTEALLAQSGAVVAFIEPEILKLSEERLSAFRQQEAGLREYSFYFDNLLRQREHVLSEPEEAILSKLSEITQLPENIFTMLATADMKFPQTVDEDGNATELSEGRFSLLIRSSDRQVRQQAFSKLLQTYHQYRNTFATMLLGNIKQNVFYSRTRKYSSTLAANLSDDNIPEEVYKTLIHTINNNLAPLHRYVLLKKRFLQLQEIHMYDLYTPLVKDVKFNVTYDEAANLVCQALEPLGKEYLAILQQGLTAGWIDVYENKGKQTGAYSWGSYGTHPFVLLNYHDRYDDVSTLAHEMGHAIHSYYSQTNQPFATASYTTFCAEVASTTNEILLLQHMLKTASDSQLRLYLINQHLELIRATVYRQSMFAEFEMLLYEKEEQGEALTAATLDALWRDLSTRYYGPEIIVDKEIDIEWARIPHFYWSFYVYQYVTGFSAATALAKKLLEEPRSAQDQYIRFLKSGGADYSLNILRRAGVDMSSPQPILVTLDGFSKMLDELEKLLH